MTFYKNKGFIKIFCSITLLAIMLSGLLLVHGADDTQNVESRYQLKEYVDTSKSLQKMQYRLYIPDDYNESIAYPLVIFLGGAGQNVGDQVEESEDSNKYIDSSLLANGNDKKYPCIILVPLLPVDYYWVDNFFGEISPGLDLTMGMIDSICQEYSVDQRKIYITGLCFGANGTWDILFRYPKKFAAGVPVAGIGPSALASKISDVPVWLFNSDSDSSVPVSESRGMAEALSKAGNTKIRYTEYNNYTHIETTVAAFWNNDLFPWMFSQTNTNAPFPDGKVPVEIAEEDLVMENPHNGEVNYEPVTAGDYDSIQDPTKSLKKSSLQIVIVLAVIIICLGLLFLLIYKKFLFRGTDVQLKKRKKE